MQQQAALFLPPRHTFLSAQASNKVRRFLSSPWTFVSIQYARSFLQCLDLYSTNILQNSTIQPSFIRGLPWYLGLLFLSSSHRSSYFVLSNISK